MNLIQGRECLKKIVSTKEKAATKTWARIMSGNMHYTSYFVMMKTKMLSWIIFVMPFQNKNNSTKVLSLVLKTYNERKEKIQERIGYEEYE
jgi:hypothetical protein